METAHGEGAETHSLTMVQFPGAAGYLAVVQVMRKDAILLRNQEVYERALASQETQRQTTTTPVQGDARDTVPEAAAAQSTSASPWSAAGRPSALRHTFAERDILTRIDHPYIVRLHYAFTTRSGIVCRLSLQVAPGLGRGKAEGGVLTLNQCGRTGPVRRFVSHRYASSCKWALHCGFRPTPPTDCRHALVGGCLKRQLEDLPGAGLCERRPPLFPAVPPRDVHGARGEALHRTDSSSHRAPALIGHHPPRP